MMPTSDRGTGESKMKGTGPGRNLMRAEMRRGQNGPDSNPRSIAVTLLVLSRE